MSDEAIECHHNYVSRERHREADVFVTRKGAISARAGELGIVPRIDGRALLHRSGTRQCRELRVLRARRRTADEPWRSKAQFTTADVVEQTAGIECRKDAGVTERNPGRVQAD